MVMWRWYFAMVVWDPITCHVRKNVSYIQEFCPYSPFDFSSLPANLMSLSGGFQLMSEKCSHVMWDVILLLNNFCSVHEDSELKLALLYVCSSYTIRRHHYKHLALVRTWWLSNAIMVFFYSVTKTLMKILIPLQRFKWLLLLHTSR